LVAGPARDDERMAVAEARLELRELDPLSQQLPLLPQIAHRVLGERLERLGHAASLVRERPLERVGVLDAAGCKTGAVAIEAGTAHRRELALAHGLEQIGAGRVDQAHARPDERERAGVRKSP